MKIIIPGGSGQVGTILARAFHQDGHEVIILSRKLYQAPWRVIQWDAQTLGDWTTEFEDADVIINLAGRSVNCRYHAENRRLIMDSRVNSTHAVGQAIAQAQNPPRIWLQASTATIYAHRYDAPNDDITGIIGGNEPNTPDTWRFSVNVARAWEKATDAYDLPQTRTVKLRAAVVLSPDPGGIYDVLLGLARRGVGGTNGNGKQYVSWIHHQDFVNAIRWTIEHDELEGAITYAAPNPLPNAEFNRILRQAAGVRIGLPATAWMLEIAAFFMRTETELVLKSRRVISNRLIQSGFTFQYETWAETANDLYQAWRKMRV